MRFVRVLLMVALVLSLAACAETTPTPTRTATPTPGNFNPPTYDGEPVFTLLDASLVDGRLEVVLDKDRERHPEWFAEPVLLTGSDQIEGEVWGGSPPYTVVFQGVSQGVGEMVVEFPKVNVGINAGTIQPASAAVIQGPDGESLVITERGAEMMDYVIHYRPPTPYGPRIGEAIIRLGETEIRNTGSGGSYTRDLARNEGVIVFPPGAGELAKEEGAVLEVVDFVQTFKIRIPVTLAP